MTQHVYFDTSALVKRYVTESGSDAVARLCAEAEYQITSVATEAELPAALARAVRVGAISRDDGDLAVQAWEREREDLLWIQLVQPIVRQAGQLAWQYGLRGYDAIHLAAALWWRANMGQPLLLVTYDRELWGAAQRSGLMVFPQTE